jgi:hypothetical protein
LAKRLIGAVAPGDSQWWAWILGVVTSVVFVAEGVRRLLFVYFEYEWTVALID